MRRHNERIYRAARAILRNEAEAEDVMQQAYVNAYTHLHQFDGRAQFATWLTRIAVHEALARARRRGRYDSLEDPPWTRSCPFSQDRTPNGRRSHGSSARCSNQPVDRLGDGYREVFMLRQVEGLSTSETAQVLDVSEDVVKTRLSRARTALQRDLLDQAGEAAASAFTFGLSRCDRVVAAVMATISAQE
jgi:RNA polymerase sigma-70 factor (ECF subfamily)